MAEHPTSPVSPAVASSLNTAALPGDSHPTRRAMDATNLKLLMELLSKLPLMARVAVMHVLRLSEPAAYLDLRSELIVSVLRSFMQPAKPRSIAAVQKFSLRDQGVKGRIWVSTYTSLPPPETGIRDALIGAVKSMANPDLPPPEVVVPEFAAVEAEWTGYRAGASPGDAPPSISEADKYREMMKEVTHPTTVMYLHGGAYYMYDPSSHRPTTKKLAKLTGGRCYSVRYRLAPQHPFPAALLDALASYFTLLYPPPDAYHEAVKPEHIVVSGDSAGGGLTLGLLQLILELRRQNLKVMWHGELREVPLPAGTACNSPWLDVTQSSPAWGGEAPSTFDYLPKPAAVARSRVPPCDIWPANPPRRHLYAADDLVTHPLASPVMSRSWAGSPPMYICTGWEILASEDKYLAKKLDTDAGVPVVFEEFEAMPHVFALILMNTPGSKRCYEGWANFIRTTVDDPTKVVPKALTIRARTLEEVPLKFEELSELKDEEVWARVIAKAATKARTRSGPETPAKL